MERSLAWRRLASSLFGDEAEAEADGADELHGGDGDGDAARSEGPLRLGVYPILGVLGRGAMGTVFLARDEALARDVAIKVIKVREGDDVLRARERVIDEARALARVCHPAVVTVHSVFEEGGRVHIVMERIVGQSLRRWQERPLRGWREVLEIYLQVASGLQAAHDRGVVHRDLKPDNVLVTPEGRPRIIDFGLSALAASDDRQAPVAGTPAFMAPEQARGAPADPAMDLYALCLALRDALRRCGRGEGEPSADPVPAGVEAVLERGLSVEPGRRWPSMRALIVATQGALAMTQAERHRLLLLHRVESAWIDGVLARPRGASTPIFGSALATARARDPQGAAPLEGRPQGRDDRGALAGDGSLLILGEAGTGKTTALLELARDALARARTDLQSPAPVILNLSSWTLHARRGRGLSLDRWLVMALRDEYGIPGRIAEPWVDDDRLMLFLDGLDEVAPDSLAACVEAIAGYRREHLTPLRLTCRSDTFGALEAAGVRLGIEAIVELRPLDPEAVMVLLERSGPALAGLRSALVGDPELRTMLAGSPLLLDAAARAFADRPMPAVESGSPEALRAVIWDAYIARMIERRPLERSAAAAMIRGLRALARRLEAAALSELWIDRVQPSWLPSGLSRALYRVCTLGLVWAGAALIIAATLGPATTGAIVIPTSLLAATALTIAVATVQPLGEIRPVERLTWSSRAMLRGAARALLRALMVGLALALIATLVWALGEGAEVIAAVFVGNLVLYAGLFSLLFVVFAGLVGQSPAPQVMPNEGTRSAARNALRAASITAAAVAVPLCLLTLLFGAPSPPPGAWSAEATGAGATSGVIEAVELWREAPLRFAIAVQACIAASLGYVAGLLRGFLGVVQHGVLRLLLAATGELPLRLVTLLERARERALVQRIGGGYRFIHASLRQHLGRTASAGRA